MADALAHPLLAHPDLAHQLHLRPAGIEPLFAHPLLTHSLLAPTTSTPILDRVLVGFLALALVTILGGILRHRYIQRVGGPDRTDVETIGCTHCGYQNRLHHEHCQYCRRSLADRHPITSH